MANHDGGVSTRQQMADEYGVCRKTINRLLLKKQIKPEKRLIFPWDKMNINL